MLDVGRQHDISASNDHIHDDFAFLDLAALEDLDKIEVDHLLHVDLTR